MSKFVIESRPETLYIRLPTYTEGMKPARQVVLSMLWKDKYEGPYIVFDVDAAGVVIGVEIVGDDDDGD